MLLRTHLFAASRRVACRRAAFRSAVSRLAASRLTIAAAVASVTVLAATAQTAPQVLPYTMSTFAGPHAAYSAGTACGAYTALDTYGDGCLAPMVSVGTDPHDIRVDGQGNVYWLDDTNPVIIHRIDALTQRETAYVGSQANTKVCAGAATKYGDNCPSTDGAANAQATPNLFTASLAKGRGMAVAANGDLFFADYSGNYDHKVSATTGLFTIIAGYSASTGAGTAGYADGAAGKNLVNGTRGIGVDAAGNAYIADTANNVIRLYTAATGSVTTVTALSGAEPGTGTTTCVKSLATAMPASSVQLCAPEDSQVDSRGNVIIADYGNSLVRVIYGGNGGPFFGIAAPQAGYMYTVAGTGVTLAAGVIPPQPANGSPATLANMSIRKLSADAAGNLYLADSGFNVIWFVDVRTGGIRLLAGNYGATAGSAPIGCAAATAANSTVGDGCPGPQASLFNSSDLANAVDNQGNLYITDAEGANAAASRLRKLRSGLNFPATTGAAPITQNIDLHFAAGDGPATAAAYTVGNPAGTAGAVDYATGNANCTVAADTTQDCILPVTFTPSRPGFDTATLTVKSALGGAASFLLTGTGTLSSTVIDPGGVTAVNTAVKAPAGVTLDGNGNRYTADTGNNRVLITPKGGTPATFAGTGTAGFSGDGGAAAAATLNAPTAVAVDTDGNVYIADTGNNRVRRVNITGVITTVAGGATTVCSNATDAFGNGCAGTAAKLAAPSGLAMDATGTLYIADTGNNVIRVLNTFGTVTQFAGGASAVCATNTDVAGDGCAALSATFKSPAGLAYDLSGNSIVVADSGNSTVRRILLGRTILTTTTPTTVQINPVSLVAGTGAPGSLVDNSGSAALSQLNGPLAVAVGAASTVYIADTGNDAIRYVSKAGTIGTIVGIDGAAGTGVVPGSAAAVLLNGPAGVAVDQIGNLAIADTGNNRILADARSQVSYNFGRINVGSSSSPVVFTELSNGTVAATLPTPLLTSSGSTSQFTFGSSSGSNGCASGTFAAGATCTFTGQFNSTVAGPQQATYTETGSGVAGGDGAVTLIGVGAILQPTTTSVAQTTPASGSPQFGGPFAVTATVSSTCNPSAPTCTPTGTVTFSVDGIALAPVPLGANAMATKSITGLSVGQHAIGCMYSGDDYYGASACAPITITVNAGSTTSVLTTSQNNQPQFSPVTISALVTGSGGVPTGTVTFSANGTAIGTASVNATTGVASITLMATYNADGSIKTNTTLLPGNYQLTCAYSGSANYSPSTCAAVSFTVAPEAVDFVLAARGCGANQLYQQDTTTPFINAICPSTPAGNPAQAAVAVAQGSTTDATIFITPSNTLSGTSSYKCSGLPQYTTCTFSPTSVTFSAGTGSPVPSYVDVTFWTDLQPGTVPQTSSVRAPLLPNNHAGGIALASLLGWPALVIGFGGIVGFRRRHGSRALTLTALLLLLGGGSLVTTGCGGLGIYHAVLTPTGTYPITVSVTVGNVTHSVVINWTVTQGIAGEQ